MRNDFKRTHFMTKEVDYKVLYFIRVEGKWISVTKEVYKVCRNSYMKIYYDKKRQEKSYLFTEMEEFASYDYYDPILHIEKVFTREMITSLLQLLTKEEQDIIRYIFYYDMTEQSVAEKLHTSQQLINYKKKKILKKLKNLLLKRF